MPAPHLGPDRHAADTRQLVERSGREPGIHVSARAFWVAFAIVLFAIGLFALLLWWS